MHRKNPDASRRPSMHDDFVDASTRRHRYRHMNPAAPYVTEESRWRAVAGRDRDADGAFFYGVRTTGVYCRPGCASRRPHRDNVEFFDAAGEAERAGYRPCKRCRPEANSPQEKRVDLVRRACRRLETADTPPTLEQLADEAGLSRWHFQRVFKATVGVTPRQYCSSAQSRRFRDHLRNGESVTEAIHESGFGSTSSAYQSARNELAMTPSTYRGGAAGERIRYGIAPCSLGWIAVATTERGICAVELGDDPGALCNCLERDLPHARLEEDEAELAAALRAVIACIDSPGETFDLPLDIRGTAFRKRVWQALREIPSGETVSYAELADRIGRPDAARAVAGACAANRLAVLVPCHRAIRSDGGLGGYRWGIKRKRALLNREH